MSLGLHLIKSLIDDGLGPSAITRAGLKKSDFTKIERTALKFYVDFWVRYQRVPSSSTVEKSCSLKFPTIAESSDFYLDQMRKQRQLTIARNVRDSLEDAIQKLDIESLGKIIFDGSAELSKLGDRVAISQVRDHLDGILRDHDRKFLNTITGIPFGFPILDKLTMGAQKSDFIIVSGRPGSMKTYFLLHFAMSAYLHGKRVIFVTLEMDAQQVARRASALLARISEDRIRFGKLGLIGRNKLIESVRLTDEAAELFLIMEGGLQTTVEETIIQLQELRPDVIYLDGISIFQTDARFSNQSERLGYTFKKFRSLALDMKIPVFASHWLNRQAQKRGGGSIDHAYGSDAAGQYATLFMSLDSPAMVSSMLNEDPIFKKLHIGKSRESLLKYEYTIKFDPLHTSFEEVPDGFDMTDPEYLEEDAN